MPDDFANQPDAAAGAVQSAASSRDAPLEPGPADGSTVSYRQGEDSATSQAGDAQGNAGLSSAAPRRLGDYELLGVIARGGMGVVYKARQVRLNRLVALKMIAEGEFASAEHVRRFHTEAEAAARLDHPGIVQVYEAGEIDGRHFFSMAYVEGQSLNRRVKDDGPLTAQVAARLLAAVARAVQFAHQRGIVHRDIKPHNILLDEHDVPRLADFGLAKHVHGLSELTATGQILGTPNYMPPEQAAGGADEAGPAADVYALGATLYCTLAGRPPFQASTQVETVRQVLDEQPAPLRQLNAEIPRDLETICLRCLEKEPARRYPSAELLADDLERFLAGEPIQARPAGAFERAWKWARRNPASAALWGVSAVAAAAIVAATVSMRYQAELAATNSSLTSTQQTLENRNQELAKTNTALVSAQAETQSALETAAQERDAANEARRQLAQQRYVSDLAIAGRAWQEGDVGRMLALLQRQVPQSGAEDLCGFEWHYLRGLERQEVWRSEDGVSRLSPDGKYLAVGDAMAPCVRLLNPYTREVLRELPGYEIGAPEFCFSRDGSRLIVAVAGNEAVVWDVEGGHIVGRLLAEDLCLAAVQLNQDGSLATTSGQGDDHTIRLWDVATGTQLKEWRFGGYAMLAAFSPDGQQLAFSSGLSNVQVHDLESDQVAWQIESLPDWLHELHYDPSGRLVTVCNNNAISFWNAASGLPENPPAATAGLHGDCLDISADGRYYLTGDAEDGALRLWEGATGHEVASRKGHALKLVRVSLHPSGEWALSQSYDGSTRYWNLRGPQEYSELVTSYPAVGQLRYSPDPAADILALGVDRGMLLLADHGRLRLLNSQESPVSQYVFSADGRTLFTCHYDGTAIFWDVATGEQVHSLPSDTPPVFEVALHPAADLAATVNADQTVRVWDAATCRELYRLPAPTTNNGAVKICFQPGGNALVISQAFEGLQRIELTDPPEVIPLGNALQTYQIFFSPDGQRIVTLIGLNAVVWSFPQLERELELQGHGDNINSCSFSPDGRRLATLSADRELKLWDLATGQELLTISTQGDLSVAFRADGRRIATAGRGSAIQFWTAEERAAEAATPAP